MRTKEVIPGPAGGNTTLRQRLFLGVSRSIVIVLQAVVYPIARLAQKQKPSTRGPRQLLIGAGVRGWELIEFQEIFASASEYLGENNVSQVAFTGERPMLGELRSALRQFRPSHYYFDPRSGSQTSLKALWEALVIGVMLERDGVTPICALTDFPVRLWRLQAAIVSARTGVVTSLMSPSVIGGLFPHKRIVGPVPFPLSVVTLERLQERKKSTRQNHHSLNDKAVFVGMLYEPRKTTIEAIQKGLAERGIPMEIIGRMPDGSRISDDEYWNVIASARLVVSTSSQIAGKHTDCDGHTHFIYKFIEVTAVGTALAIEPVAGSEQLLQPDVDFIAYKSPEEAVRKISALWAERGALEELALRGADAARSIVKTSRYWSQVLPEIPDVPGGDARRGG